MIHNTTPIRSNVNTGWRQGADAYKVHVLSLTNTLRYRLPSPMQHPFPVLPQRVQQRSDAGLSFSATHEVTHGTAHSTEGGGQAHVLQGRTGTTSPRGRATADRSERAEERVTNPVRGPATGVRRVH